MSTSFEILFNRLEINDKQGLFRFSNIADWESLFPYRTIRALKSIAPYAIYAVNNNNETNSHFVPVYLFIDNSNRIEQQISLPKLWNFQTPVVIVDNGNQWFWYSGEYLNENRTLNELISPIHKSKIDESIDIDDFSFWNIHSGSLWKKFEGKFKEENGNKNKKKLQTYLLQNIEKAIKILTTEDIKIQHEDNRQIANNLIGRLIFVRYLIDRKVKLNFQYIDDNNQRVDFENIILQKERLYSLFEYLKSPDKFNGDLFPFFKNSIEVEKRLINDEHLRVLHELFLGENLLEDQRQYSLASLFNLYDFNIIPVELISNIYERFIGKEGQKKEGAFYTPPFLVDYVLKHTIEPYLIDNSTCKVLDPSCGSGIFLVEALRKLIERNKKDGKIKNIDELKIEAQKTGKPLKKLIELNDTNLKQIVESNIFGIDKDPSAVTVAIFSIYITILDYKEPKEIENFKLPELIDKNFFVRNFFDNELDILLKDTKFDFIIGNPPWGSVSKEPKHKEYVEKNSNIISDYQIAQSFTIRINDFCTENTECALIVGSKILYSIDGAKFRNFFINNYQLNRVLELSTVRHDVFTGADAPSAILFFKFKPNENKDNNVVHYISLKPNRFFKLFKIIVIEKYDYKKVKQSYFINDWIWKVLLYGNLLDIKFFENYFENVSDKIKIDDFLSNNELFFGAGYIIGDKNRKAKANELYNKKVVKKDFLQPNFIFEEDLKLFEDEFNNIELIKDKGRQKAYMSPHLLIKRGISAIPVVAFSDFECVFPNTVYDISGNTNQIKLLKALGALFSTSFYSYLMFFKSSQWGVERNEVYKDDYVETQIINLSNDIIDKLATSFEQNEIFAKEDFANILKQEHIEGIEPTSKNKKDALNKYKKLVTTSKKYSIDKTIFELYDIDNEEQALIDYTLNVSIPLFENKESPFRTLSLKDKAIENYINVFFEKNKSFLEWKGVFMSADVYFDKRNYIIVNFIFEENKPKNLINYPKDDEKQNKFSFLANLFSLPERICENSNTLFMQKDLKGIEKTSFYVIKPNEFKNWHPAVAYLDYYEFKDAFIKAGRENKLKAN